MELFCPKCGKETDADGQFCQWCGADIELEMANMDKVKSKVLSEIDSKIQDAKNFLKKCGYIVFSEQEYQKFGMYIQIKILLAGILAFLSGYVFCKMFWG